LVESLDAPTEKGGKILSSSRRNVLGAFAVGATVALLPRTAARAQVYGVPAPTSNTTATVFPTVKRPRPRFGPMVEEFPIKLPAGKQLGRSVAVTVAPNGDVFFLQNAETGHSIPPPAARLPRVVHVSSSGQFINAWGGPDAAPPVDGVSQWPEGYDGIDCDDEGNLWIGGYGQNDDAVLKFAPDGKFLQRFGQRFRAGNNASRELLNSSPSVYHDVKNREVFIADGYGNNRVIAFNSDTGKFTRMWGAYGQDPSTLTPEAAFGIPVHKIARAPDGLMYVCDRMKCRVQEFELIPGGVRYLREVYIAPGTAGMGSCFDCAFTPDNKYMYVADGMNERVWSVDRKTFEVLGWANVATEPEGDYNITNQLTALHRFALMPSGDLLLARVRPGLQVLKYLGVR
jgi:hypothetical protein